MGSRVDPSGSTSSSSGATKITASPQRKEREEPGEGGVVRGLNLVVLRPVRGWNLVVLILESNSSRKERVEPGVLRGWNLVVLRAGGTLCTWILVWF